jgi:hypothetical protein
MAFDFLAYALLMTGLTLAIGRLAPDLAGLPLVCGFGGGALGLLWGILGLKGYRCPKWTVLTLATISALLVPLNINTWRTVETDKSEPRLVSILTALMLFFSIAQLIIFMREGKSVDDDPSK